MVSAATPTLLAETASATLFVALELSRSTWLVALHAPLTNKVSQHRLDGGDTNGLLALIARKRGQAQAGPSGGEAGPACSRRVLFRGWLRRLLAASLAVRPRHRKPGAGCRQSAGQPPGAAGQDGPPRCRRALAHPDDAGARRGPGLPGRARPHARAGGRPSPVARASPARRRAWSAHQPPQGTADDPGHSRLRADPAGLAGAVCGRGA